MKWLTSALVFLLAAHGLAQNDNYHIATPAGLFVKDRITGDMTLLNNVMIQPLYGDIWDFNGTRNPTWIIPDSTTANVCLIDITDGAGQILTSGGYLTMPVTVCIDVVGNQLLVTDWANSVVVAIDLAGNQSLFLDNSSGLLDGPTGICFGPDGNLFIGNLNNGTVLILPPGGPLRLLTDGNGITQQVGGLVTDGSGNLFAADWEADLIARIRIDSGETVVHCSDTILDGPNDIKLDRDGKILTTTFDSFALVEIDALGSATTLDQNSKLGSWQGIAVDRDFPYGTGRCLPYGTGTAGTGGWVPELHGIYSPNIGANYGLEIRDALGGAAGFLHVGLAAACLNGLGGKLLVSFQPGWQLLRLVHPGSGPGNGDVVLPTTLTSDPALVGLSVFMQDLVLDPGAPRGLAMSNGLEIRIGV